MSSGKICPHCSGAEIEFDSARGDAVCTSCGSVLEDNAIVSEVQFEENAYGGSSAIGQFVAADSQGGGTGFNVGYRGGSGKESREITMQKARAKITALAQQLRLNQHCIDTACNFYKMALMRRATYGRKSQNMVAACIYITCRTEGTPHLLIDIADVMNVDVYSLGHTYLQLSKILCISIPSLDPCVYVLRFANSLELGEKAHEVSMTALRLLQRMKRDWIHTGRRPSGLCGAALLIAARLHDFSRTVNDVIRVVKVHEGTVRKRLLEFGQTPSSLLTLEEFMTVDLEEEQDPPAFRNSRRKDREKLQKAIDGDPDVEEELVELEKEIERQLEERRAKMRGPYAKYAKEALALQDAPSSEAASPADQESQELENFIAQETLETINQCLTAPQESAASSVQDESVLMPPPDSTYLQLRHHLRPTVSSLGIKDHSHPAEKSAEESVDTETEENDGELDLEGIDDKEIDSYLMTPAESRLKATMWMKLNGEFLVELEEKRKRKAQEEEEKKNDPKRKKRTFQKKPKQTTVANTPAEAIEKMLQEKKISTKINYDVLKSLSGLGSTAGTAAQPVLEPKLEKSSDTKEEKAPVAKKRAQPNVSLAGTRNTLAQVAVVSETKVDQRVTVSEVETEEVEDDEEEYVEEDKEHEMSAATLLSKMRGDAESEFADYEDYY